MVIYEVSLSVSPNILAPFRAWLDGHVEEMLRFDGFQSAEICVVEEEQANGRRDIVVLYRVANRARLQEYFDRHSARMRGEGLARFGADSFQATRRILAIQETLGGPVSF